MLIPPCECIGGTVVGIAASNSMLGLLYFSFVLKAFFSVKFHSTIRNQIQNVKVFSIKKLQKWQQKDKEHKHATHPKIQKQVFQKSKQGDLFTLLPPLSPLIYLLDQEIQEQDTELNSGEEAAALLHP